MATKVTVTCDLCHEEIDTAKDQPFEIKLFVETKGRYSSYAPPPDRTADWCRDCVVAMGLRVPHKNETKPDPEPTLEDIIRNIAREEARDEVRSQ